MKKFEEKSEQEERILQEEVLEAVRSLEEIIKADMLKHWQKEQPPKGIKRKGKI